MSRIGLIGSETQACVSEPIKPILDNVVTFGAGHFYVSQSDKGEMVMGGDLDGYNSYAQRGNLPTLQHVLTEGIAIPSVNTCCKVGKFPL